MKIHFWATTAALFFVCTICTAAAPANGSINRTVSSPLYDVLNLLEGPLFNRISIFLDDYGSNGSAGAPSYVKFGSQTISTFYLPHLKNPSNRWHIQNIASNGIDLMVNSNDPTKLGVFVDFETDDREIICITRASNNIDQGLSGHIHQPQIEMALTLKNQGNLITYDVNKVT